MKTFVYVLAILALIIWIVVGIGVIQNYATGDHNCTIQDSSSDYLHYVCKNRDFYRHK